MTDSDDDFEFNYEHFKELAELQVTEESTEIPPEPHSKTDVVNKSRKLRPEMYMDQEELVASRLDAMKATDEERAAVELGALAAIEYRRNGTVEKTAMDHINEVTTDVKRCVRLLNVVIPLARSIAKQESEA